MTVPYQTPPTAVADQPLAAATWNAGVRDSIESLAKPPRAVAFRNTTQLIANNVVTPVVWAGTLISTDAFWSGANPSRLTVPAGLGGTYLATFHPIYAIHGTGARYSALARNGVAYHSPENSGGSAAWYIQHALSLPMELNPGDYVEGLVYQTSGAGLNLAADVYIATLSLTRIGV